MRAILFGIILLPALSFAQQMPKNPAKDACVEKVRREFIECNAHATTDIERQKCQDTMNQEERECSKLKK
jgi:hypothetical protein